MDIQTRKLAFIQDFLEVQSETLVIKLQQLLQAANKPTIFDSISQVELDARIDKSIMDSESNRITESQVLLDEIDHWQ